MPDAAANIHPTAVIGPDVVLHPSASVGPYCVLSGNVSIGPRTILLEHCTIQGAAQIGTDCRIGPHAAVGTPPQHSGYEGQETWSVLDDGVVVREFATVHRAMHPGIDHATRVGTGSMLMVGAHVGHDSRVGAHVTLANTVLLGGHVTVGDRAFIGGGAVVHQFARVGRLAMIGGNETLPRDVMPFGAIIWRRHKGYNAVGCRRAGMSPQAVHALRAAFRVIHASQSATIAAKQLRLQWAELVPEVRELVEFIETSHRGITPSAAGNARESGD